jgi:hypothetical protein
MSNQPCLEFRGLESELLSSKGFCYDGEVLGSLQFFYGIAFTPPDNVVDVKFAAVPENGVASE